MRFDHAVILVADLERAIADYRSLGFTVSPGGVHTGGGTRNALIAFADETYIELLAFTRGIPTRLLPVLGQIGLGGLIGKGHSPMEQRFRRRAEHGLGLIDYALVCDDLDEDLERLRREGIRVEGPITGGRSATENEAVSWRIALAVPKELPFLCADVTDRELRVPSGAAREHVNGVIGIAGITVGVRSVEISSARYRAMLGMEPDPEARERLRNARGRVFRLGGTELIVASSTEPTHPIRKQLKTRGEGPHSLLLRVRSGSQPPLLKPGRTHGARLELTTRAGEPAR